MKAKLLALTVVALMIVSGMAIVSADKGGNGAPPGKHYNLNIIGIPKQKNDNFNGGNGARIFVDRTGQTQFYVFGGDTYEIRDHDGTDGRVGEPGLGYENAGIVFPYSNGEWHVEIWVRLVGPKGSQIHWKSEYWNGSEYALIDEFNISKTKKFSCETGRLLKDGYQDILWTLDPTTKFRNLQMRIYLE